jgi:hypothetical protein
MGFKQHLQGGKLVWLEPPVDVPIHELTKWMMREMVKGGRNTRPKTQTHTPRYKLSFTSLARLTKPIESPKERPRGRIFGGEIGDESKHKIM